MLSVCLLSLLDIHEPTRDQSAGAFVLAETIQAWRAAHKKR